MRYILTGLRRPETSTAPSFAGATTYITHNGCTTHSAEKCAVLPTLAEAQAELDYWTKTQPLVRWTIEQLPPRVAVKNAVLRAKPV